MNSKEEKSGHRTFDSQADYVGTGNVYSNVQFSNYIRGKRETECNDREFKEGELRESDLKPFTKSLRIPSHILDSVLKSTEGDKSHILYSFFHYNGKERIMHGYILTTDHNDGHKLVNSWTTGRTHKSESVMNWAISKVAKKKEPKNDPMPSAYNICKNPMMNSMIMSKQ